MGKGVSWMGMEAVGTGDWRGEGRRDVLRARNRSSERIAMAFMRRTLANKVLVRL